MLKVFRFLCTCPVVDDAKSSAWWFLRDLCSYNEKVADLLADIPADDPTTMLNSIVETLHEAAKTTIPTKIVQLKGPKWKLSPEAAAISKRAKALHKTSLDPPLGTNLADLKAQQKETKHELRSQLRSEKAEDRRKHIEDIMTCPPGDPAVFAKLISKHRATPSETQALMVDGCLTYDPEDQCEAWATYIQQLASPLQAPHFDNDYHNQVMRDIAWIETLCGLHTPSHNWK